MDTVGINRSSVITSSGIPENPNKESQAANAPSVSKFHRLNQWAAEFRRTYRWDSARQLNLLQLVSGSLFRGIYDPKTFASGQISEKAAVAFLKGIHEALTSPDKFDIDRLSGFLDEIDAAEPKNLYPVLFAASELVRYFPLLNPTRYQNIEPVFQFLTEEVGCLDTEQLKNRDFILTQTPVATPVAGNRFNWHFNWKVCAAALVAIAAAGGALYGIYSSTRNPLPWLGNNVFENSMNGTADNRTAIVQIGPKQSRNPRFGYRLKFNSEEVS